MVNQSTDLSPDLEAKTITRDVAKALAEDLGTGDLTADLVDKDVVSTMEVRARENCILCGKPWFAEVFRQLGTRETIQWNYADGNNIDADTAVCTLEASARILLSGERTALNFLQLLSATATTTRTYVEAVKDTRTRILDTRKTIPGLRTAQKYAVRCGGGKNHRHGLYDAILIKENHIIAAGSISAAVTNGRNRAPSTMLEVEVETLDELGEALDSGVDQIMLDNFSLDQLNSAVRERDARASNIKLEASGGIDLDGIRAIAQTGVDFISVGALTKHMRAIDFTMRFFDNV
jgi:nicotinate-nucleotide pyrophosphorylase (carboxylating)